MHFSSVKLIAPIMFLLLCAAPCAAGEARTTLPSNWVKVVEAANKEGKIVAGIPASAELRKTLGAAFKARFPAVELEMTNARGPSNAVKIAAEYAAGVRYYDLLISGASTPFNLLNAGILEAVGPMLIMPEVKDPQALVRRPHVAR